jgi:hypothetical protein
MRTPVDAASQLLTTSLVVGLLKLYNGGGRYHMHGWIDSWLISSTKASIFSWRSRSLTVMLGNRTDAELRGMTLVGEAKENDGVLGLGDLLMELLGII